MNNRKTSDQLPNTNQAYEQIWNLESAEEEAKIGFGLKVLRNASLKKHEQMYITYGERANSFLLTEYGFAIPNNRYDFVRRSNLTLATFYGDLMVVSPAVKARFEEKLLELGMKDTLQADLKLMGLHRDVLKLLRFFEKAKAQESHSA